MAIKRVTQAYEKKLPLQMAKGEQAYPRRFRYTAIEWMLTLGLRPALKERVRQVTRRAKGRRVRRKGPRRKHDHHYEGIFLTPPLGEKCCPESLAFPAPNSGNSRPRLRNRRPLKRGKLPPPTDLLSAGVPAQPLEN